MPRIHPVRRFAPSLCPHRAGSQAPGRAAPRRPGAGPPVSGDTGRAVGRAGSFNSGKNAFQLVTTGKQGRFTGRLGRLGSVGGRPGHNGRPGQDSDRPTSRRLRQSECRGGSRFLPSFATGSKFPPCLAKARPGPGSRARAVGLGVPASPSQAAARRQQDTESGLLTDAGTITAATITDQSRVTT